VDWISNHIKSIVQQLSLTFKANRL